jgi:Co/Zn/Cd efflux system component
LDEERVALEAHVLVDDDTTMPQVEEVKKQIKTLMGERYHIEHATLEFEISSADEHDMRLLVE